MEEEKRIELTGRKEKEKPEERRRSGKRHWIKWLLVALTLILFAVFVRNLEQLFHEIGDGFYQRELSSFEYSLKAGSYSTIWREIRRQQALDMETMLDREAFDSLAEFYEASLWCYVLEQLPEREVSQDSLEEWKACREQAESRLGNTSYRFRKAAEQIQQTYPQQP